MKTKSTNRQTSQTVRLAPLCDPLEILREVRIVLSTGDNKNYFYIVKIGDNA